MIEKNNKQKDKERKEKEKMIEWTLAARLMKSFPNSFVNSSGEFVAHSYANQYFILQNCEDELAVKCKVLEWFSRGAYKTEPFRTEIKNNAFHKFMADGINEFLGTSFSEDDFEEIYTKLGNACNHQLTVKFVESDCDMEVLRT